MKEPKHPSEVPPGGWRWVEPITGKLIHAGDYRGLLNGARAFLQNNDMSIPRDLDQVVLTWMDDQIQSKAEKDGLPPYEFLVDSEKPTLAQRLRSFGHAMAAWKASGYAVVTKEVLAEREDQCMSCGWWRGFATTGLGSCGKCGCTGIKLFLASSKCPLNPPRW